MTSKGTMMRNVRKYLRGWLVALAAGSFAIASLGCDSEGEAAERSGQSERQHQAVEQSWSAEQGEDSRHTTAIGLSFRVPEGWEVKSSAPAVKLRPEERPRAGAAQYMVALRFAPDGLEAISEGDYLDELAEQYAGRVPGAEVALREAGLETESGEGAVVAWDIPKERGPKRVAFFMTVDAPWMIVLRASGPRSRIAGNDAMLREVLESVELRDANVDPELVGLWRRAEPRASGGAELSRTMELREDGTMVLTTSPESVSGGRTTRDLGRWSVRDGEMIQYAADRREGGVWTAAKAREFLEGGEVLKLGSGDEAVRWERR